MASSSIIIGAFFKIALAMEIRCFSPPDSDLPASPADVSYPFGSFVIKSSQHAAFAAAYISSSEALGFPRRIFSFKEQLKRKLSCVTKLTKFESCFRGIFFILVSPI